MYKKFNANAGCYTLRIHDAATLEMINELADEYSNRTAALNACLAAGAPLVYEEIFRRKANRKTQEKDVDALGSTAKHIKELRLTQDDIYVIINNLEYMLATLFNVKLMELEDVPVNEEMMRQGLLSELPVELQPVKKELLFRYSHSNKDK